MSTMKDQPTDPSESEIAVACQQLQATWSDREKRARQLWMPTVMVRRGNPDNMDQERPLEVQLMRPNQAELPEYEIPEVNTRLL